MKHSARLLPVLFLATTLPAAPPAPSPAPAALAPDLAGLADAKVWRVVNGKVRVAEEDGRRVVHLSPIGGNRKGSNVAMALVQGLELAEGTFEIYLRGNPEGNASFVGVAFGVTDGSAHEAVYFRPFNFKSEDPARRAHAVQYVAWPEHTWEKLRAEKPGAYEAAVAPAPDPLGWFHARIEVTAPLSRRGPPRRRRRPGRLRAVGRQPGRLLRRLPRPARRLTARSSALQFVGKPRSRMSASMRASRPRNSVAMPWLNFAARCTFSRSSGGSGFPVFTWSAKRVRTSGVSSQCWSRFEGTSP